MNIMALRNKDKDFSIKYRYYIEPDTDSGGWILRKEGSNSIMKKAKYKLMLLYFAENMLNRKKAELRVCDSNGMLEEVINFERFIKKN
jgi:hypothetical protein